MGDVKELVAAMAVLVGTVTLLSILAVTLQRCDAPREVICLPDGGRP